MSSVESIPPAIADKYRLSQEQRYIIQFLHEMDINYESIALRVHCSIPTVRLWCKRNFTTSMPNTGRRNKLSLDHLARMDELISYDPTLSSNDLK